MFWAGGREASRVLCKLGVSAVHDGKGGVGWHRQGAQQAWDLVREACLRIRAQGAGTVLTGARAGRRLLMPHTSYTLAIRFRRVYPRTRGHRGRMSAAVPPSRGKKSSQDLKKTCFQKQSRSQKSMLWGDFDHDFEGVVPTSGAPGRLPSIPPAPPPELRKPASALSICPASASSGPHPRHPQPGSPEDADG